MKTRVIGILTLLTLIFSSHAATGQVHSLRLSGGDYQIADRGQDYALFQKITASSDSFGKQIFQTNQFTLLENSLHYFDQGEWKVSEDLIEPSPAGAVALRGPHKASFSADLNAEAVFDIQAPDGHWVRGGVRAIQLTDLSTGKSMVLGTVKNSVKGQLMPPNQILYANAFDGIQADVLLV